MAYLQCASHLLYICSSSIVKQEEKIEPDQLANPARNKNWRSTCSEREMTSAVIDWDSSWTKNSHTRIMFFSKFWQKRIIAACLYFMYFFALSCSCLCGWSGQVSLLTPPLAGMVFCPSVLGPGSNFESNFAFFYSDYSDNGHIVDFKDRRSFLQCFT